MKEACRDKLVASSLGRGMKEGEVCVKSNKFVTWSFNKFFSFSPFSWCACVCVCVYVCVFCVIMIGTL